MNEQRDFPDDLAGSAEIDLEREVERLREALEAKSREAEATRDRYVRAIAEFDNYRKRATREREEYVRFAGESLVRELLPVLDNFERALQAARQDPAAAHLRSTHPARLLRGSARGVTLLRGGGDVRSGAAGDRARPPT
jgi:molecular chaperone GrpE (heat shock protein)